MGGIFPEDGPSRVRTRVQTEDQEVVARHRARSIVELLRSGESDKLGIVSAVPGRCNGEECIEVLLTDDADENRLERIISSGPDGPRIVFRRSRWFKLAPDD